MPLFVETHRTKTERRRERADAPGLERGVRQLLADKVSGTMVGLWLLVAEHLRLGTWDLLVGWTGRPPDGVEPRLALQLVHEAALCVAGIRQRRALSQKGFELANGLPFVASDPAIHDLLDAHTVAEACALQLALGRIRRASGHFQGRCLAIDPHRMRSFSKRQMRRRQSPHETTAYKTAQTFFCLDVDTHQPVAFTTASAARTVTQATPELLAMAQAILQPSDPRPLVLADTEHISAELFDHVRRDTPFDLLAPLPRQQERDKKIQALPPETFTPHWAGFATAVLPYQLHHGQSALFQFVQRCGERADQYRFKSFLSTRHDNAVDALTRDYPDRWHVEEFFNTHQPLGWKRAGTLNLNIRYGQMTMALLAQAAIYQLRQRLGPPFHAWEAGHMARDLFGGLDGDLRVHHETIVVTFYNAPNADQLRPHYEHLPEKLQDEQVDPHIPWLYNFKLDFRFK